MSSYWKMLTRSSLAIAIPLLIVAVFASAWLFRGPAGVKEERTPQLAKDEIVLLRTVGGRLQVSTLIKNEEFAWQSTFTCPLIDCSSLLGKTVSKAILPVHYTYSIPLAAEWRMKLRETHFELNVPKEEPNIPPGLDTAKMQIETEKGWLSPSGNQNSMSLVKHLGPELQTRALRSDYIAAQREIARKTVGEFARKWMIEQGAGKDKKDYPIKVFFAGETF